MKKIYAFCLLALFFCAAASAAGLDANAPKTITAPKIEYDVTEKAIKTTGDTSITNESGQSINLVDAIVKEIISVEEVDFLSNGFKYLVKVVYDSCGVESETTLIFKTKEDAEKVKVGYEFLT